jgi:hypothetical protein
MFGHNVMEKIKRADSLSVQLERSDRYMDAMHTYEQSAKMLVRYRPVCITAKLPF